MIAVVACRAQGAGFSHPCRRVCCNPAGSPSRKLASWVFVTIISHTRYGGASTAVTPRDYTALSTVARVKTPFIWFGDADETDGLCRQAQRRSRRAGPLYGQRAGILL